MLRKISFLLLSAVTFVGCAGMNPDNEPNQNLEVGENLSLVTSIAPVYSLTAHLVEGVDNVTVSNLVPPNISVHNFALKPSNAISIENANLVVINGLGLEEFLSDFQADYAEKFVDTSVGVETRENEDYEKHDDHEKASYEEQDDHEGHDHHDEDHDDHGHASHEEHDDHDDHEGHNHGPLDVHIWLSPENAKIQAANIKDALVEVDPENAEVYETNFQMLSEKLDTFTENAKNTLAGVEQKPYLTFHDAYGYFEETFGLESAGTLKDVHGNDLSPKVLSELVAEIEAENVNIVFTEPQFSPKLVETLKEEYNLVVEVLDPLGQNISKDSYLEMMEANVKAFERAFKN
jgi:zinc transport system substrate-binding protein